MTSPQVARATCHSGYWHDSALVPYTVEGMGIHQRRPLVNRAFGSRGSYVYVSQKREHGRPAGRSYSRFSLILSRTRLAFGLARKNMFKICCEDTGQI